MARLTRDEILGIALIGLGLIALLLWLPLGSNAGPGPLAAGFGWGAAVIVVAAVLGGIAIAFAGRFGWQVRWQAIASLELLLISLLAFSHVGQPLAAAEAGEGGGLVGWGISQLLTEVLGPTGTRLALLAIAGLAIWLTWRALPDDWTRPLSDRAVAVWGRCRSVIAGLLHRDDAGRVEPVEPEPETPGVPILRRVRRKSAAEPPPPTPPAQPAGGKKARPRTAARPDWLPPMELLRRDEGSSSTPSDVKQRAKLLKDTLADFGVPVEVVSIKEGPTVTQFGLEPGEIVRELRSGEVVRRRVSVQSILRLNNDLALALAAASIRIEAPVPGQPYVGVEVPNPAKSRVSLRGVLESKEFARVPLPLAVALGRDVAGDPIVADLARMPHLLIAGSTGSGKSVCINALVCSLLMNNDADAVRLLMVDPKMVELPGYNGIPHLLGPVITDPAEAAAALAWLMMQMDERYRAFADAGVRNIAEFNRKFARSRDPRPLPYLILVIDELADLMMTAADDIERQICRLAQMARATGIHLVLATQRPSVDVITGLIKANFPARVAFAVTTQIDSRVILDTPGAEKLLGRGDMLFMAPDSSKLQRIQGCFVSDGEIDSVVRFWKEQVAADAAQAGQARPPVQAAPWESFFGLHDKAHDQLLDQALKLISHKTTVSTSLLQRQLRVGFPRAARLMDQLEELGAVGPDEGGGRSREVLYRPESTGADVTTS
jgi:DNA segregation ATPase FtsK/SpoIIIE, S-DNA-T family